MSNPNHQKIAQLVDNDLEPNEALALLKTMQQQPELQAKLRRYALAQHALKSNTVISAAPDFSQRLSQRLAEEPIHFLPQRAKSQQRYKLSSALAIAASIAIVAVFIPLTSKIASTEKAGALTVSQAAPENELASQQMRMYPVNRRFQDYLQAHNSSAYVSGASNIQTQVKLVEYDYR